MNPLQEYDFKLMSEIHPVPELFEGEFFYLDFPEPETYDMTGLDQYFMKLFTDQWFIPLMLNEIEKSVNKLINKIFQERPSLP